MAIAYLPPPHNDPPFQKVRSYYELEGDSSRVLVEQSLSALAQWQNRPGYVVEAEDDVETINHVPFKKVGTIKVRFKQSYPMKPRVIDIEEFEPE